MTSRSTEPQVRPEGSPNNAKLLVAAGAVFVVTLGVLLFPTPTPVEGGVSMQDGSLWRILIAVVLAIAVGVQVLFRRLVAKRAGVKATLRGVRVEAQAHADAPLLSSLLKRVPVYILGDATDPNPTQPVNAGPAVVLTGGQRDSHAIVFPGRAWSRLHHSPALLVAVLAHEEAHIVNDDVRTLHVAALTIKGAFYAFSSAVSVGWLLATYRYAADGGSLTEALRGVSVQKSMLIIAMIGLGLLHVLNVRLAWWREAIADRSAIDLVGVEALQEALTRLFGAIDRTRFSRPFRLRELEPVDAALFGALLGFSSTYLGGWSASYGALLVAFSTFTRMVSLTAYYVFPAVLLSLYMSSVAAATEAKAVFALGAAAVGYILCNALATELPQLLQWGLKPADFAIPYPYDGPARIASNAYRVGVSATWLAALAVAGAVYDRHRASGGLIPSTMWGACAVLEPWTCGTLTGGAITVVVTIIAFGIALTIAARSGLKVLAAALILLLVVWSSGIAAGLGDVTTVAACLNRRGAVASENGHLEKAEQSFYYATLLAPRVPREWRDLAILREQRGDVHGMVDAYRHAAGAAALQGDYSDLFLARGEFGTALMVRRADGDLPAAEVQLASAIQLWTDYGVFSVRTLADIQYNAACLAALLGDRRAAIVRLAAVANAESTLCRETGTTPSRMHQALRDDDLMALGLRDATPTRHPGAMRLLFFIPARAGTVEQAVRRSLEAAHVSEQDMVETFAHLAQDPKSMPCAPEEQR